MSEELSVSEAEAVLERIVRNQLAISELQEQNEALKGFFKERPEAFVAGSSQKFGRFYIKVSSNSRIDPIALLKTYPADKYKYLYKQVPDAAKVRAYLGDKAEAYTKKYDNRIEIGMVNE